MVSLQKGGIGNLGRGKIKALYTPREESSIASCDNNILKLQRTLIGIGIGLWHDDVIVASCIVSIAGTVHRPRGTV